MEKSPSSQLRNLPYIIEQCREPDIHNPLLEVSVPNRQAAFSCSQYPSSTRVYDPGEARARATQLRREAELRLRFADTLSAFADKHAPEPASPART